MLCSPGSLVLLGRAGEQQWGGGYETGFGPPKCRNWRLSSSTVRARARRPAPHLALANPFGGTEQRSAAKLPSFLHLALHFSVLSSPPAVHNPCCLPRPLPDTHLRASPRSFPNLCGAPNAPFSLPTAGVLPARSACPGIATLFPLPSPCPPRSAQAWRPPRSLPSPASCCGIQGPASRYWAPCCCLHLKSTAKAPA